MMRKDCDNLSLAPARAHARPSARAPMWIVPVSALICASSGDVLAGTVRMWPTAVVVGDTIVLSDLCELQGFDRQTEQMLSGLVITTAPAPGETRVVNLEALRSVLSAGGANMARVTLSGAGQCRVTRPSVSVASQSGSVLKRDARRTAGRVSHSAATPRSGADDPTTLRQAVLDHFEAEFARYGGRADVVFDRTAGGTLGLSGPAYRFAVRRLSGTPLGLVQLQVDVVADGKTVQTVPMVAQVSMYRSVVVAHRAINAGATIQASDVELQSLTFAKLDQLGLDEVFRVIGQRAKRFLSAGTVVQPGQLEQVPLVTRGQLVRLTSVSGSVQVVTSAKAMREGLLGQTIPVRMADGKRLQLDAVVVAPGAVQVGGGVALSAMRLAGRGYP